MKTKLVYVLTCLADDHYIEQALMAVYSARHWNPTANIVLVVDDQTDQLLVGKRSEILQYISERIVIPFDDASLSMTYRSRYIKTSVRKYIEGDFLFIDCDTITQKPLTEIDRIKYDLGAVLESHLKVDDFCDPLFQHHQDRVSIYGLNLSEEEFYFSSGVLFVKESLISHKLYNLWFQNWRDGYEKGLRADQPALAKANHDLGHAIKRMPDTYNCILFTQPVFAEESHILHISSYKNPSLLFVNKTFEYIKKNGINNDWLKESILHPCSSFLPFDYQVYHSTFRNRIAWIKDRSRFLTGYGRIIDSSFGDFQMASRFRGIIVGLLQNNTFIAMCLWMFWKRVHLLGKKSLLKKNICSK